MIAELAQEDQMQEEWRPIPGYGDLYEVSNTGKVRSIGRKTESVRLHCGHSPHTYTREFPSKELKLIFRKGRYIAHLHRRVNGKQYSEYIPVSELVSRAFPKLCP